MSERIRDNDYTTTSMDNEGIEEFVCPVCDELGDDCECGEDEDAEPG